MDPMTHKTPGRTMTRAGERVDEFIGDVKEQARIVKSEYIDMGWNKTRDFVRENPGKSLLMAAGVGLMLGALLGRRR